MVEKKCECVCCSKHFEFELSGFLLDEIATESVVIFAGADVSTEGTYTHPNSLREQLLVALGSNDSEMAFPDLAQALTDQPDGEFKLLKIIQARFDYISKFSDLWCSATRFHNELATMPYLKTFVTTNWDRFFEEVCAAKPFTQNSDMRFWDLPDRKVLKLHGTIDNYSSIVATRSDYHTSAKRLSKSLVGSKLKDLLSNKTCIFVGYSMADDDFKEIYSFVQSALGRFSKTHFFVSPFEQNEISDKNIIHVKTDGSFFLSAIKDHMCENFCYLPDNLYKRVEVELRKVENAHAKLWKEFAANKHPQILMPAFYQDGLIHCYKLVLDSRSSGRFSELHHLIGAVQSYEKWIKDYRRRKNYVRASYFEGYTNALQGIANQFRGGSGRFPPRYFFIKPGAIDELEFRSVFSEAPYLHKAAFKQCKQEVENLPDDGSLVLQAPPWG